MRVWRELPLARAEASAPSLRAMARRVAVTVHPDLASGGEERLAAVIPDLGPATAMDQLLVVLTEAEAAGATERGHLAGDVAALRQQVLDG